MDLSKQYYEEMQNKDIRECIKKFFVETNIIMIRLSASKPRQINFM